MQQQLFIIPLVSILSNCLTHKYDRECDIALFAFAADKNDLSSVEIYPSDLCQSKPFLGVSYFLLLVEKLKPCMNYADFYITGTVHVHLLLYCVIVYLNKILEYQY